MCSPAPASPASTATAPRQTLATGSASLLLLFFYSCIFLQEIYHLWQLAGGDVQAELRRHGLLVTAAPVLALPVLATSEGQTFGAPKQRHTLHDRTVLPLCVSQLTKSLASLTVEQLAPLVDQQEEGDLSSRLLPLVIRERDVR